MICIRGRPVAGTYDENDKARIAWIAIPGCRYQVFCKSDLSETDWTPLSEELVAEAIEMSWTVPEDASEPGVFYAVKELLDLNDRTILAFGADNPAIQIAESSIPSAGGHCYFPRHAICCFSHFKTLRRHCVALHDFRNGSIWSCSSS